MALRVGPLTSTGQAVSFGALVSKDGGRRSSAGRVCVMRFGEEQQFCKQQQQVQGLGHWGSPIVKKSVSYRRRVRGNASAELASGGGGDEGGNGVKGYGGGDGESEDGGKDGGKIREEALMALSAMGKTLENLPADLASAIQEGRITGSIVKKYFELQDSKFLGWLLNFAGFKERLLADDLFMTKVGIECGVGIFTKTAAELEKRKENFSKELDFVIADVVMALIADFMLVWLPAPTVSLRPRLTSGAGKLAKFFYNCPDNAFQVALGAQSFTLLQRIGAIVRNGSKLLAVGTTASLVGTASTNALIAVRRKLDKNFEGESEDIPILQTSLAYGVYMAISSNLRYQILAGVVEQRILEPMLHNQKLLLSVMSFAVRTGNTFLGSLMWVDYARWVGVQKDRGVEAASAIEGAAAAIEDAASSAGVAPA
ncbi:hypothetical protein M758_9G048700 [Ceratodon purpureus]|uniref:Uncharacterized protein n=1 Tax=Ceratodon purpureus TaxID=3225 RepID=A0A8T0GRP2_CERPU|nr:hypothetical protein KC19_9G049200 [Ceratodon purpureus]KAG0605319.1 hypothetical protein M758_9G048700 [Ceratodon purpureus]